MTTYRFYCMNRRSSVDAVKVDELIDDDDARMIADELLHNTGAYALEVWTRSRLVARLECASAPG
jgi:hypothetical protein